MAQINSCALQNETITAAMFASKCNSKSEVYRFLVLDCDAFLPDYKTITIYFLKDLLSGAKKCKYPSFRHLFE